MSKCQSFACDCLYDVFSNSCLILFIFICRVMFQPHYIFIAQNYIQIKLSSSQRQSQGQNTKNNHSHFGININSNHPVVSVPDMKKWKAALKLSKI